MRHKACILPCLVGKIPWFIAVNKKVLRNREADSTKKWLMARAIKRILMVDDEAEFVNTINRHLRREGFIVDSADDVEKARSKIDDSVRLQNPYDLVITDVIMPNMGALELLPWIKENHPEISVIIVSGFGSNDILREVMREDLDRCAPKPLTPQKMISLINSLDQNRGKS